MSFEVTEGARAEALSPDAAAPVGTEAPAGEDSERGAEPQPEPPPVYRGADLLVEVLKEEGAEMLFGIPGGATINFYDALYNSGIPHVLARHEQGAIHAADGYARISGKVPVVTGTSGPGSTNLMTGIANAWFDSVPMVIIAGQVSTSVMGTDAFQESPIFSMTMGITKHNYQLMRGEDLPRVVKESFYLARTGRKGPVLIELPKDMTSNEIPYRKPVEMRLRAYNPTPKIDRALVEKVKRDLARAKRPVIVAGAGVVHAGASELLRAFAERARVPVVHTLLGLGTLPSDHPLSLGMGGMHGTVWANMALHECDFLLNIGSRFDDRLTGALEHFAPRARIAHVDIDEAELGKVLDEDYPIHGDARDALAILLDGAVDPSPSEEWLAYLESLRREYPLWYRTDRPYLQPQRVVQIASDLASDDVIVVTDVGQHQMWVAQFFRFRRPGRFVTSGGLGAMGFGLPAAIGAQIADRDALVLAFVGDGGLQMTVEELILLREYDLPVKILLFNNNSLGMVRQWQELFYEERYSATLFNIQPDFMRLADAYGIVGRRVETEEEARAVLEEAFRTRAPYLIEFVIDPMANVLPMVPPGNGVHEMEGVKPE
ncbi:MAG: biosynthetic-type acetolactate synthase large subunit [Brockia lithotrophica]|nr:biosynthetic-type acetolactate synthase large subunit [Brockia lithotrophica]